MLVCVLGTLFNLANILVLTHRDMRNPVNMILTGIAVTDFLNNLEYIPFTVHMNIYDIEGRHPEEKVKERKILDHTKENTPTHPISPLQLGQACNQIYLSSLFVVGLLVLISYYCNTLTETYLEIYLQFPKILIQGIHIMDILWDSSL